MLKLSNRTGTAGLVKLVPSRGSCLPCPTRPLFAPRQETVQHPGPRYCISHDRTPINENFEEEKCNSSEVSSIQGSRKVSIVGANRNKLSRTVQTIAHAPAFSAEPTRRTMNADLHHLLRTRLRDHGPLTVLLCR